MKLLASFLALSASLVASQARSVKVSDFFVDKHEDPITLRIRIYAVSFILNGFDAENLRCELRNPPTFPTNIWPCNDEGSNYRMVIHEGTEGSGIQFGLSLYYDDGHQNLNMQGLGDVPTYCTLNEEDHEWREFRYNCEQLLPASISLTCAYRCADESR